MLKDQKLIKINCLCGQKPVVKRKRVCAGAKTKYYYLTCSDNNCEYEICTFGTRLLECSFELWGATIVKMKEMGLDKIK